MAFTFGKLVIMVPNKSSEPPVSNPNLDSNNILNKLGPQLQDSERKAKRQNELKKIELSKAEKTKAVNNYYSVPNATKKNKKLAKSRTLVTGESFVVKNSKYIEELMNSQKR